MAYRKVVTGNDNIASETASHNRVHVELGESGKIFAVFVCLCVIAVVIFMAFAHRDWLEGLLVVTFVGVFVGLWLVALSYLIRHSVTTYTVVIANRAQQREEASNVRVRAQAENYLLWVDETGKSHFESTVSIVENRHFPAQITAPPNYNDTILDLYDNLKSARAVEKALDKRVSYYEIQKVLDKYRPGWSTPAKKIVESDIANDAI